MYGQSSRTVKFDTVTLKVSFKVTHIGDLILPKGEELRHIL